MPFVVTGSFAQDSAAVGQMIDGLPDTKRAILVSTGGMLVRRQRTHFDQLSRTGSANGVTWPRMDDDTLKRRQALKRRGLLANADPSQLGVMTGDLARGFRAVRTETSVRLVNVDPKAGYFAGRRPLYPNTIPSAWVATADLIAQRKLDGLAASVSLDSGKGST